MKYSYHRVALPFKEKLLWGYLPSIYKGYLPVNFKGYGILVTLYTRII